MPSIMMGDPQRRDEGVIRWGGFGWTPIQLIRPASTLASGAWVKSSDGLAANLHTMLDETVADPSDRITATAAGAAASIGMQAATTPVARTGHKLRIQHKETGAAGIIVRWKQGATVIASWTVVPAPADVIVEYELTPAQAANITDYSNISVDLEPI